MRGSSTIFGKIGESDTSCCGQVPLRRDHGRCRLMVRLSTLILLQLKDKCV